MEAFIDTSYTDVAVEQPWKEAVALPVEGERVAVGVQRAPSRWLTLATFLISDAVALCLAAATSYFLLKSRLAGVQVEVVMLWGLLSVLLIVSYALSGLYSVVAVHPAEEIRRVWVITPVSFLAFAAAVLFQWPEWMLALSIAATLGMTAFFVALGRVFVRFLCASAAWWGHAVVVIGRGEAAVDTVRTLSRWPELGFKPVALVDEAERRSEVEGVPVVNEVRDAFRLAQDKRVPYAILTMPLQQSAQFLGKIGRYTKFFDRVVVMPSGLGTWATWTSSRFFQGMLGYDVQHPRRKRVARWLKRGGDVLGALLGILVLTPLWLAIMVFIKLDSQGPIFFRQTRLGKDGRTFEVLKFRSMHVDAERRLQALLAQDVALELEYETFHKLRQDPRVTRVGSLLRRYSLDELPQLWNILLGEMSLVGPRAYLPAELPKMCGLERVILQNGPGLSGLWQVSGRNNVSFEERISMDTHYANNWNFWLDVYILARTVPVVIRGEGAC
jgi:Undecaprenyl-phosphate galactose phosphotransferase WbaP